MLIELVVPKRIEERLRMESERSGLSIEEIALEALYRGLGEVLNSLERAETYRELSEKYFTEAERLSQIG